MTSSIPASAPVDITGRPLLSVTGLEIRDAEGSPLVEGISFEVNRGEALAIVGESGCGKSLTSLAIMGLLPPKLAKTRRGDVFFDGEDLTRISDKALRKLRGNRLSMVFQEPLTALNPLLTIGAQIVEVLRTHRNMSPRDARARAIELLGQVKLPDPERRFGDYPHRLSGGQRQRVTIAMAIACNPSLIIADEPTTALDVTVQAQILQLLAEIRAETGQSLMLITHDLGVVGQVADRMVVIYAGVVAESGPVGEVLTQPRHPYTAGLLSARPKGNFAETGEQVTDIPGAVPAPNNRPKGCLFAPRCPRVQTRCTESRPPLVEAGDRAHSCFFPLEG
jgi:oligopeptide/dipeptide ABC transporter ATP-binding protein